mmetsp:Transcript_4335/g.6365  ORF Transcript_4335/g.6365 Transcript_4335/m.6365 type:complete len:94 (-) Transcript_4335:1648-1929(-)
MCFPEVVSNLLIQGLDESNNVEELDSKLIRDTDTGRAPRKRRVGLVPIPPVITSTLTRTELPSSRPTVKTVSAMDASLAPEVVDDPICCRATE